MSAILRLGFTCLACVLMGTAALGQGTVEAYRADLTVPFGEIPVRIVPVDDFLVFIDEENPGTSFVVRRDDITNATAEADRVSMNLLNPIEDRSGHTQGLSFRVRERGTADALARWHQQPAALEERAYQEPRREPVRDDVRDEPRVEVFDAPDPVAEEERPAVFAVEERNYEARHLHFFGSCRGTLTITDNMVIYDSPENPNHSREWRLGELQDVRMHDSRFVTVYPRDETHYNIELTERGIARATIDELLDAIAATRRAE
jgi:hypothetical protein